MYGELYQYLLLHKQLNIPGIGTFLLERNPAETDFASKLINPPSYTLSLHHGPSSPSKKLYGWLAAALGISERDAVIRFNDFAFDLKDKLTGGDKFDWKGVGILSKGLAGEIRFETALKDKITGPPIAAVKVLRDNAEHTVRVGEDEKTSVEMIEFLSTTEERKSWWWVAALIVTLLSFIFISYYFSVNGLSTSSAGNRQKLVPDTSVSSSRTSP